METSDETNGDPMRAVFDDVMASERAAAPEEPQTAFGETLKDAGVDVTVSPKPEPVLEQGAPQSEQAPEVAPEAAPAAPEATQQVEDPFTEDGFDALTRNEAPGEFRTAAMAESESIEQQAKELGLAPGLARALARNTPRKEAQEFLQQQRDRLQSAPAGQSVDPVSAPTGYEAPRFDASEVLRAVEAEAGEATAKAVADLYASVQADAAEAKRIATATAHDIAARQDREQWRAAADGLTGRFPGLVRDGRLNPDQSLIQSALALKMHGPDGIRGNHAASLEAAARMQFGEAPPSRQSTTATPTPQTPTPGATPQPVGSQPLTGKDAVERMLSIEREHRNNPAARDKAYDAEVRLQKAHTVDIRKR